MAHFPPKIPPMTQNWPSIPNQTLSICNPNAATTATTTTTNSNSPTMSQNDRPSWVDEFSDFTSLRRGSNRRSISDSIAFLETPLFLEEPHIQTSTNTNNNSSINHHNNLSNVTISMATGGLNFDRLDEEQLMSIFSNDLSLALLPTSPNSSTPSSDHNSNNEEKPTVLLNIRCPVLKPLSSPQQQVEQEQQPELQPQNLMVEAEPGEVESSCKQEPQETSPQPPSSSNSDPVIDPKRVKRILANRQSAQRSRVRKLQYISELERSVTTLQTEVTALSPRVAFLDHQRLLLTVDNSALKQRIAALGQDKIFKDAHQKALKKEIERLRQVYHQQNHQNMNNGSDNPNNSNAMQCSEKEQLLMG